jgi:flavin-dependent dehydrogenase
MPPGTALPTEPDVLVIGGGPAGSTAAALLAGRGWQVLLLEKSRHPRFHIGESLLPKNLPILDRLGVLDRVRAIGVRKLGADFPDRSGGYGTFRFERALDPLDRSAFQVRRADFDRILFERAGEAGADCRELAEVLAVELEPGARARVRVRTDDGERTLRPRYVVDASGRDALLGSRWKLKRRDRHHQSAAIFSHFRGVERRPGEDAGNITVQRFEHGWIWMIPLPDDVMSIGAVCFPDYLRQRRGDSEGLLDRTLAAQPGIAERMRGAQRVAPVHVTGNYSYACRRMAGPGWILVGDAYTFLDPIFSSGVYLAMDGAEQAAAVVDGALREPAREAALQRAMQRRLQRGLRWFSWFIYRFNTPAVGRLFANPRNVWQVEQAVISLLGGDVFDNPRVWRRLRLFQLFYLGASLRLLPAALASWWRRRRQPRMRFEVETLHLDGRRGAE